MVSADRVRELIQLGNENRNLDYKGAFSWDHAEHDEKCEIVKDILAFSNTRDGGRVLIGVNDKSGVPEGLTEEQYSSFDQTRFNSFVHRYADPRHTSNVHRITVDGDRLVVIDVPEFAEVPILCARDAHSSANPNKQILRKAALYKRTEKATSEVIEDAGEMRELLNRGLLRRQDELFRAIKQIVRPTESAPPTAFSDEFKREIESASTYFAELGDGILDKPPYWTVRMQPGEYIPSRVGAASALQQMVQSSAISLRGWTFPIAGRVSGAGWSNFEGGTQSSHIGSVVHSPEALRVYKSGLVIWRSGVWEEYWGAFAGQGANSFVSLIYATTEWCLFAARFFEQILSVDESLSIAVTASGFKGRRLISADPLVVLFEDYRINIPTFEVSETLAMPELRSDPEAVARRLVRQIFELFNWNNPDEQMLRDWQRKFIERRF